ncbi:MAG: hypothetical protein AVDCRST_MAG38-2238, partial [uncultured Solirubrobacteraceae bacterium]
EASSARQRAVDPVPGALPGHARRPGARGSRRLQPRAGRPSGRAGPARALRHVIGVRGRPDGELAVGVPPVHPLHPGHRLAGAARIDGVQGHRRRRRRDRRAAEAGRPRRVRIAALGQGRGAAHAGLLELARAADDGDLAGVVVRAAGHRARRLQSGAARPSAGAADARAVRGLIRLLDPHGPELAVRVPGGRLDGPVLHLAAPARLGAIEAGRRSARVDGLGGL